MTDERQGLDQRAGVGPAVLGGRALGGVRTVMKDILYGIFLALLVIAFLAKAIAEVLR